MVKNQYLITSDPSFKNDVLSSKCTISEVTIFSHQGLDITTLSKGQWKFALIGFILNPLKPRASNLEILQHVSLCKNEEHLFQNLEVLSGKYVLVASFNGKTLLLNDCFGERQLYYTFFNNTFYASSSEKLLIDALGWKFNITTSKEKLKNSYHFLNITEYWFLTEASWDDRLKQLVPNHFICLNTRKIKRVPLFVIKNVPKAEILEATQKILVGTIEAILHRYKTLRIPITAGYDSRVILSASIAHKDQIKYHTFWRPNTYVKRDVRIAQKLSEKFNLNHAIYKLNPLRESFLKKYRNQFLVPRILAKTSIVQFFKDRKPCSEINLSGNGGEFFRNFYKMENFGSTDSIFKEIDVEQNALQESGLKEWLSKSENFSSKHCIEIQDLFYHEIRLGKWASQFYHELDFSGIEFFSPFNNKNLVYSILLNIQKKERDTFKGNFIEELMEKMLEGSTTIAFNPPTWKDRIKNKIPYDKMKQYLRAIKN